MIAHIKEMSVRVNEWLTEETFKEGVVICQSVPGATAMQMAAYVGLRVRGVRGAIASYAGFGLPAFLLMLALAVFYTGSRELPLVVSLFRGLQVMVVAIVANATFTFGRDIGKKPSNLVLAGVAAALFGLGVSPFAVIVGAGIAGAVLFRDAPPPPPSGNREGDAGRVPRPVILIAILACAGVAGLYFSDRKLYHLAALMLRIAQEPHPRIRIIRPDLPAGLDEFFDRALAKHPADRIESGAALARALRDVNVAAGG